MTPARPADSPNPPASGRARAGQAVQAAAVVLLLACVAGRCFLAEMPFRTSTLPAVAAPSEGADDDVVAERNELSRVTWAVLILSAATLWLAGGVMAGGATLRFAWLGVAMALFAGLSLVSALAASDVRSALDVWIDQVSLMAAGLLAVQMFRDRGRFGLLMAVLVGVGAALAVKGAWQYFVEAPERIADFELYRGERLEQTGWAPGSPQAKLVEMRLGDRAPFGYFGLANVFASLMGMLLLAAVGLGTGRLRWASRTRADRRGGRRGEIDTPTLAAVVTLVLAAMVAAVVALTGSEGAIGAFGLALLGAAGAYAFGRRLATRWRRLVAAAVLVAIAGGGMTIFVGRRNDRLPSKTLTVRWYYWTASAEIVADHPWLGVGPGNFPAAYLRYRRPAAEESVKTPHNVIVHALAQFGAPGGVLFLLIVAAVVICACRPSRGIAELDAARAPPGSPAAGLVVAGAVTAAVFFARTGLGGATHPYLLIFEAAAPALLTGVFVLLACWAGRGLAEGVRSAGRAARIALAAACVGFVVHNMVTYTFWTPGVAMVFWVAAGAAIARSGRGTDRRLGRAGRVGWVVCAAATIATAVVLWMPVYARTVLLEASAARLRAGDEQRAVELAVAASNADPLDPLAAMDAAGVIQTTAPREGEPARAALNRALNQARKAVERDRWRAATHRLVGRIEWRLGVADRWTYAWRPAAGRLDQAQRRVERAMRRGGDSAMLLADAAAVHRARGDYAAAAEALLAALQRDPDSSVLWDRLGEAYWLAGRTEQADEAWRKADRIVREIPSAGDGLAAMREAVGLDTWNSRLALEYAGMLVDSTRPVAAVIALRWVDLADESLTDESVERLNGDERQRLQLIRAKAVAVSDRLTD